MKRPAEQVRFVIRRFRQLALFALGAGALMLVLSGCTNNVFSPLFWKCTQGSTDACLEYEKTYGSVSDTSPQTSPDLSLVARPGNREVYLAWTDVQREEEKGNYVVYRSEGGGEPRLIAVWGARQLRGAGKCLLDRTVTNSKRYSYEVTWQWEDPSQWSGNKRSNKVFVTPAATEPTRTPATECAFVGHSQLAPTPPPLRVTAEAGDRELMLTWDRGGRSGDFVVRQGPGNPFHELVTVPPDRQPCVVVRGLDNDREYQYSVGARADGARSGIVSVTPRAGARSLFPQVGCVFVGGARSLAAHAAARVTSTTLTARMRGRVVQRGKFVHRGGKFVANGYRLAGTMTAKLTQTGRSRVLPAGTWRARLDFTVDPRARKAIVKGTVVVSSVTGKICLAYYSSTQPGASKSLRGAFSVLGATGEAATVFPRGTFLADQVGAASWTLSGRGSVGGGKAKALPKRCRAL